MRKEPLHQLGWHQPLQTQKQLPISLVLPAMRENERKLNDPSEVVMAAGAECAVNT